MYSKQKNFKLMLFALLFFIVFNSQKYNLSLMNSECNSNNDSSIKTNNIQFIKPKLTINDTNFTQYRILFDEAHQPLKATDDSSYWLPPYQLAKAAKDCEKIGHIVDKLSTEDITSDILNNCDLLIIPCSQGYYTQSEMDCLYNWVKYQGGNLLLLVSQILEGNFLEIPENFGYTFSDDTIRDEDDSIVWSIAFYEENFKFEEITYNLDRIELSYIRTVTSMPESATEVIVTDTDGTAYFELNHKLSIGEPIAIIEKFTEEIEGRLAIINNLDFLDCLLDDSHDGIMNYSEEDNSKLWKNSVNWLLNSEGKLTIDNDNDNLSDYTEVFTYHSSTESNDTDLDGLYDNIEAMIGSSLLTNDTDLDGLSDFEEYTVYHTNPSKIDTDGDGLTDKEEVEITGTDPNKEDTDDDNIPDKAEIELSLDPFNATDATLDYDDDGLLNIEEYQRRTNLRSNDTDGDKINDYTEVYVYLTSPINNDTDRDNLTDYEELFIYHTNPKLRDTDQDGYFDGEEISWGTDPLDPNDFPPPPFTSPEESNNGLQTLLIGNNIFKPVIITVIILTLFHISKTKIKRK